MKIYKQFTHHHVKGLELMIQNILKYLTISIERIQKNNTNEKNKEKKEMTDMFKNLDDLGRNAEFLLKQQKLGRWSVGLTKSIFIYDASVVSDEADEAPMDSMEEETENDEYLETEGDD